MITTTIATGWSGATSTGRQIQAHRDYYVHEIQIAGENGALLDQDVTIKARTVEGDGFITIATSSASATSAENEFGRSVRFIGRYSEIIVSAASTFGASATFTVRLSSVQLTTENRRVTVIANGDTQLSSRDRISGVTEGHESMSVHQISLSSATDTGTYRVFASAADSVNEWVRIGTLDLSSGSDQVFVTGRYKAFMVEKTTTAGGSESLMFVVSSVDNLGVFGEWELTQDEINQLKNINSTTISAAQWAYVGAMDQGTASTDRVDFTGDSDFAPAVTINDNGGGSAWARLDFDNSNVGSNAIVYLNSIGDLVMRNLNAGRVIQLIIDATQKLSANSTGVRIGTGTPTETLDVNGAATFNSNRVKSVATPEAGTDAANRDYVHRRQIKTYYYLSSSESIGTSYATVANWTTGSINADDSSFASGVWTFTTLTDLIVHCVLGADNTSGSARTEFEGKVEYSLDSGSWTIANGGRVFGYCRIAGNGSLGQGSCVCFVPGASAATDVRVRVQVLKRGTDTLQLEANACSVSMQEIEGI